MCGRMRIVFTVFTFYYYTLCLSTSDITFDGQRTEERANIIPDSELNYQQLFKEGNNLADEYYEFDFDNKNLNKKEKEENLSNNLQNFTKNKDFLYRKQTKFFKNGNFYTNNERNSMGTEMVRNSTLGIRKRISKRSPSSQDTQNQDKHLPNDISDFLKYFFNNIEHSATNAKLQREVVNDMIRTAKISEINNLARNAKVRLFMKFHMPFKPQYADPLSEEFQEVNRTLWEELVPAMNKSMNNKLFGFTLKKLTPGSTISESEVETTEEAAEEGQVKTAAQEAAEKNSTSYPMDSNSVEQKYEPQHFVTSRINLTVTDRKYVEGMCDVTSRSFDKEYNDTISSSVKKFGGEGIINVTVVSCTSGSVKTVAEINSTEYSARNKKGESGLKKAVENGNISYSVDPTSIVQYQWNNNTANAPNNFTMTNASSNFTITRVNMTILDKTYVEAMCDRNSKTFDKEFNDTMIKLIWEFGGSGIQDVTIVNCSLESDYLKTVLQIRSSPESAKNKSVETGLKQATNDGKVPYKIDPQTILQYDYPTKFEKTVKTILKFRIENLTYKEGMCDSQSQNYNSTFVNKISRMVERYGGDGVKSSKVTKCSPGSVATENEVESTEESAANKDAENGMQEAASNETEYKIDSESVSQSDPITNETTTTIQPSGSTPMVSSMTTKGNNTSKAPSMTTGSISGQNPANNTGNNTSKAPSMTTGSISEQNPASNTDTSSDEKLVPVILRFGITNVEFKEGMCDPNDKRNFNKTFVDKVNDMVLKHCGPGVKETNVKSCSAGSVMTENEMNSTESSANNRSAESGMKDAASKNETAYQVDEESVKQVEPSQTESTSTTSSPSGSDSSTKSSSSTTKSDSSSETTANDHSSSSESSTTSKDSITGGLARTPTTQSSSKSDTTDKNSMSSSTSTSDTSNSHSSDSTSSLDSQDNSSGSSGSSSSSSSWVSQTKDPSTTSDDSSSETQKSTTKAINSHTSSSTMENSEGSSDQTSITRPSHSTSDGETSDGTSGGTSGSGGTSDGVSDTGASDGTTGGSSDETSGSGTSGSGSSDGTSGGSSGSATSGGASGSGTSEGSSSSGTSGGSSGGGTSGGSSGSGTSGGSTGSGTSGGSSGSETSGGSSGSGTSGGSSGSGTSGGSSGSGTSGGSSGSGTSGGSSGSGTSGGSSGSGTDSTVQEKKNWKIEYLYFKHPNLIFNLKNCTNGTDEFKKFKEQRETQYKTGLSKVMGSKFFSIKVLECSEGSVDMKTQTNTTGDADTVDAMQEYAESTSGETEIDANTVRVTSQPQTVISYLDLKFKNSYQDGMCDRNSEHNEVQKMRDYNQTITQELNENLGSHFINITDVYCTKASTEDNSVIFTFKMNVTAESAKNLEESKVMSSYFKSQNNKNYVGVYQCQEDDPYGAGACTQQNGEAGMNGNSDLDDDAPDNLNSDYDSNSNKIIIMDYFYKITLPVAVGVIIVMIIFLCATSGSTLSKTSANKQV